MSDDSVNVPGVDCSTISRWESIKSYEDTRKIISGEVAEYHKVNEFWGEHASATVGVLEIVDLE